MASSRNNKFCVVVQGWVWLASVVILVAGVKAIATGQPWWHDPESYPWPQQGWYVFMLVVVHVAALVGFFAMSVELSSEDQ
jgi:hypothetical protein